VTVPTVPIQENPAIIIRDPSITLENPVWIPPGPGAYGAVFEKILDIMTDYFEIRFANRYDGYIDTYPRVSAG
jgi:hypothetical protein